MLRPGQHEEKEVAQQAREVVHQEVVHQAVHQERVFRELYVHPVVCKTNFFDNLILPGPC